MFVREESDLLSERSDTLLQTPTSREARYGFPSIDHLDRPRDNTSIYGDIHPAWLHSAPTQIDGHPTSESSVGDGPTSPSIRKGGQDVYGKLLIVCLRIGCVDDRILKID